MHIAGERFSFSPRERAGMRENSSCRFLAILLQAFVAAFWLCLEKCV